ncbi:phosphomevalonate kinase [Amycolatopsis sp. QT-25]|uniref:phosphomevalonate kinase n=1 Tax=Amycolatopsis sp. QT-25 TaxID=3034022 RepID=UPI0023EDE324|nr:phosphomevalonate kinase [Amycolatopsis sp. QT-25]WET80806.1 phosphomevalonate kinase [Amycolatopsis sp. QT-25]
MIRVDVPGKLFVAGEYAVLEPGGAAVLVAVDRFLTVRATPHDSRRTVTSEHTGGRIVDFTGAPRPVVAAVAVVERLAMDAGRRRIGFELDIRSALDEADGRKYGLGSSGAVTVGVVRALGALYGFDLKAGEVVKLALLSVFSDDPHCSGGDVAASALTGWVAYRSPDRARVAEWWSDPRTSLGDLLSRPWPLLAVENLAAPRALELVIGWTGRPAKSRSLVAAVRAGISEAGFRRFREESDACVARLVAALDEGDDQGTAHAVAEVGLLVRALGELAGVVIETPELADLRVRAEALGGVAKSSGAGGGDCGIALLPAPEDVETLRRSWRAAGVVPLDLRVHTSDDRRKGDLR